MRPLIWRPGWSPLLVCLCSALAIYSALEGNWWVVVAMTFTLLGQFLSALSARGTI